MCHCMWVAGGESVSVRSTCAMVLTCRACPHRGVRVVWGVVNVVALRHDCFVNECGCKASLQVIKRDSESWNAEPFFVCRTAMVEGFLGKEGVHLVREGASAEGFRAAGV